MLVGIRNAGAFAAAIPELNIRSLLRQALSIIAISIFFTSAGFIMAASPALPTMNGLLNPPTDAETLTLYHPSDPLTREVNTHILKHPLAVSLRAKPGFVESRPHLKIPEPMRPHNLTGGTLLGEDKIVVPPLTFTQANGESLTQMTYVGRALCGHPGIVHGGLLATLLDEGLARCCFPALPNKVGVTASLTINYKKPCLAEQYVVLKARTTRVEGRKAWVVGHIETLLSPAAIERGEVPVVLVEAEALFIEPRNAAGMARVYSSQ
ncbi:hypothetical protein LTR04_005069 [Oleoguttula sp. CCFEE 6159]|nr:hypothetical protein LTR04_005069 [Oleoguttula sp. CCFEE 6159]